MLAQLFTKEFSDVDLLIRPSSDFRISNFLLWQLAYAEFWFTDLHWPDFTKETLLKLLRHIKNENADLVAYAMRNKKC